jgi:hypothetical protein
MHQDPTVVTLSRKVKRLYATTDPTEAELIRAHLRDAGIESSLDNQLGAAYAIGIPTAASPLGIYVRDEDAAEAAEILALHFEKKDEEGEPDPDAPPPLTREESAQFEEKVRRGKPRRRFWLALIWFLPNVAAVITAVFSGQFAFAGVLLGALLGFAGILWAINALAGQARKDKEPAS